MGITRELNKEAPNVFLYYVYYYYKSYSKLHMSSISPPYYYHKANIL